MTEPTDEPISEATLEGWLIDDIERLNRLKLEIAALDDEMRTLQASICKEMQASGFDYARFTGRDGSALKATLVASYQEDVNLGILQDIDPELAAALSKTVVDRAEWRRAQALGLMDNPKYDEAITRKAKSPYILFEQEAPTTAGDDE